MGTDFDAVVVAGGQGSRMGHVSKADLDVGGERLLDIVLRATTGASTTVVVGDVAVPPGVLLTREEPAGTGPAAGVLAGLDAVASPAGWTLVLACDLPGAPDAVATLRRALASAPEEADGLALRDEGGELQHLLAFYRTEALRRAFDAWGDPANRSVRGVMANLALLPVDPDGASVEDLDTPEQLELWIRSHPAQAEPDDPAERAAWSAFVADACRRVGADPAVADEHAVLRMTRRVAHSGARPMAPVASFIAGLALREHPDVDPTALMARLQDALDTAPRPEENPHG